ncbi:transporter substrate-binding domain-containing protein [Roseomonas sp. HF4]|uniref:transporter substrate-binding domain-containing protein n=1 Tax=Roseomonas sp. HF4 TaxID=2562313 RepID=UPI0010C0097B|nr:transporter substrate-binding domain-containing protein [Roseomonas sp. HF4]
MTDRRALFAGGAAAAAAAATLLTPKDAAARSLNDVLSGGEIRVGVNPTLPPRALFNERNQIDGFEPEVAAAIARKMGVRLALQPVGSPERIPMVASGRIDFVMGAMSRTSERAKVIDYTVPVHSENYGIVAVQGRGHTSIEALNKPEVTLAQVRGTTAIAYIQRAIPNAQVLLLDNYPDRNRAIAQGRAQASFDGIDSVRFALRPFRQVQWEVTAVPEFGVTYSGLGVAKDNHSLRNWLNIALYELHTDGTIERAWEKWFDGPMFTKVPASPFF